MCLELQLEREKEYGLVLEGGGARGAYQIGAWKALKEAHISIKGIAGTSVGALNGALVCMDDLKRAEEIWENISYSRVMDVDDEQMALLMNFGLRQLSELHPGELIAAAGRIFKNRGFDIGPLKELIDFVVDEEAIRNSPRELFTVTYSMSERKSMVVDLKEAPPGQMADFLLASAYLLGFRRERLGGKYYMDGARANNVPVDVLLERGYKDVIVVRIYGLGVDTERRLLVPEDVSLYHIAPRQDLGGILEFDGKRARKNKMLGYFDAKRMLYGLQGRWYYLDAPEPEAFYFQLLLKDGGGLLSLLGLSWDENITLLGLRSMTEKLFLEAAALLKLKDSWDYRDLYLGILEELAKRCRISRFAVYRPGELLTLIYEKIRQGNLLDSAETT